jgi:hypothetical protein
MTGILVDAGIEALIAASAVGIYHFMLWPELTRRRARRHAVWLCAAVSWSVPVLLALGTVLPIPRLLPLLLLAVLLIGTQFAPAIVRVTGGPRARFADDAAISDLVRRTLDRITTGDEGQATDLIARLRGMRTPLTGRYVDLWLQYLEEEGARRPQSQTAKQNLLRQIGEEVTRLSPPPAEDRPPRAWAQVALAAVVVVVPAVWASRACIGVEAALASPLASGRASLLALAESLMDEPELGATLVVDQPMDVRAAAESRHDPDTLDQLTRAGFVAAYGRIWLAADGQQIEESVFEFTDAAGAMGYHGTVNRYACQFANEAFGGPVGGIGLQVRYSTGHHPIVEQISWVTGSRRYVVSVSALEAPPNHERVLQIAARGVAATGRGLAPAWARVSDLR